MLHYSACARDDFLLVHLGGLVSLDAWRQVLQQLEDAVKPMPHDRLVADLAGLVGWLGAHERRIVGALWAAHLARMAKVALVIQPEKITGVVEAEAQRNGLNLRLFSSHDEAMTWVIVSSA